jgi:hypothetical protein
MYRWNTDTIITTLSELPGVWGVEDGGPGGDFDSDTLVVIVEESEDNLFVRGFNTDREPEDTSDFNVEMVEISDGLDSCGGLNSRNVKTALAYVAVRQYFIDNGADVVDSMDDYF